ncbi:hypothetical protein A5892_13720 [Halotalea alkalilenta]|uniref:Uncharacterized protein n=2 Tax=Halotalea alkalilenta TaxID=376489 RepID=A0A172YGR9_9GAMM|nr:hypothetical protein A5892_13720 [Halotalea alkalilenta]
MSRPVPIAFSLRYYRRALVRANRWLGIPNWTWCLLASGSGLVATLIFSGGDYLSRLPFDLLYWLLGAVVLWVVLSLFSPSRKRLQAVAVEEHRADVARTALACRVPLSGVKLVDNDAEYDLLAAQLAENGESAVAETPETKSRPRDASLPTR